MMSPRFLSYPSQSITFPVPILLYERSEMLHWVPNRCRFQRLHSKPRFGRDIHNVLLVTSTESYWKD